MVKGANTANKTGIIHVLKAASNLKGFISHHTKIAILGPKINSAVITQHIFQGYQLVGEM
jgi:hypothetical protein